MLRNLFSTRRTPKANRKPFRPGLEALETRLVPVVGAFAIPPAVRLDDFTGVVRLTTPSGTCTGTLLYSALHILTAAHCVDADGVGGVDGPVAVRFTVPYLGAGIGIPIEVPPYRITVHPGWTGNTRMGNDLAILKLWGSFEEEWFTVSGQMVAPFGPHERGYQIYRGGDEIGQTFTAVGYGRTGTGSTGDTDPSGTKRAGQNRWDAQGLVLRNEVQAITMEGSPTGGSFTLTFGGDTTRPIPHNATVNEVRSALEALSTIGQNNVGVTPGIGAGPRWFVRFQNDLHDRDVPTMGWTSSLIGGSMRVGEWIRGASFAPRTSALAYDFDNGFDQNDPFGLLYGISDSGLGADEVKTAPGDSGGPAFLGANLISGVNSFGDSAGMPPDIDGVVNNRSFGEVGVMTRVSAWASWIDSVVTTPLENGMLMLNMQHQALGRNGATDELTIIAQRNGENLELVVSGSGSDYDGVYYAGPIADIRGLIIRGSDEDNETIIADKSLALRVQFHGGGGNDVLIGGSLFDQLYGGPGDDTLLGGDEGDSLYGGPDNDLLLGQEGRDVLYGYAGDDTLLGGSGDDMWLSGGPGDDLVYGEDGNDYFGHQDEQGAWEQGNNTLFGGSGNDTLYGAFGRDEIDEIYGEEGDDTLYGGANDYLDGGTGNDYLRGTTSAGSSLMFGGEGHDQLSGNGLLFGGPGNDRLWAATEADWNSFLDGGTGNDTLYGEGGDDYLDGGSDDDWGDGGLVQTQAAFCASGSCGSQW